MKYQLLLSILTLVISSNVFSQVKLINYGSKSVSIEFYNDSDDTAYYINPTFFFNQKIRKQEIANYLRIDMYEINVDTLILYFTDTTLSKYNSMYITMDQAREKSGIKKKKILIPQTNVKLKINFPRKLKYKFLKIKYNYSFSKDEFSDDPKGLKVSELECKVKLK